MAALFITDWASLCASVADWLNRADLTDQVPVFITLAEAQFNRELRVRDMLVRADATSAQENVELPDDFLEVYSLVVQPGSNVAALRYMSERESNDIKASMNGSAFWPPSGYTLIDGMIELVPAPSGNVDLRLVYYARIPSLGALQTSNWLLTKSPDLYLYSTLLAAAPYLKDDDRLQTWMAVRNGLAEAIRLESERAMRPTSGMVARARAL